MIPRHSMCWLAVAVLFPLGDAAGQWKVTMRPMRNPVPVGECTPIEVVVYDAQGRIGPTRPDGKQVSGWDFDFSVAAASPDAFRLQDGDPTRPFVCARAPTAATATVTAHYPGRQLRPNQVVPGVVLWQSTEVAMAGVAPGYGAGGAPAGASTTDPGYVATAGAGAYAGGGTPAAGAGSPANGDPSGNPYAAGAPAGAYPQGDPYAASGPAQGAGYPQAPVGYPQPGAARAASGSGAATTGEPESGVRSGKQFIQRITGTAKRQAGEVATSTTTHVADAAGDVVGTTLEAGSDVVKSGAGAVTGAASSSVQGVGRTLGGSPTMLDPGDVAAALAAGRAVLPGLRFTEGTAILESSSAPLISQLAGALARTPGQFLIEGHVDGKQSPAAQALSEQRASAVKAALVAAGSSPMQLAAVGYGATRPVAGAKSSARIEMARTQ